MRMASHMSFLWSFQTRAFGTVRVQFAWLESYNIHLKQTAVIKRLAFLV